MPPSRSWRGWSDDWVAQWRTGMIELATLPHVQCKLSGLLTEAAGPAREGGAAGSAALQPVWSLLVERFGAGRLIWGSDWPVLNLAADYTRWIDVSETLLDTLAEPDRGRIRHANAARFYGLSETAGLARESIHHTRSRTRTQLSSTYPRSSASV